MVDQFLTIPKDELAAEREAIPAGSLQAGDIIQLTAEGTMIWVEPRAVMGRSIWDTTDEMYITYNEEGERVLTTTGEEDIWNQSHSYQRAGSSQYDTISERLELAGAVPAGGVKRSRGIGRRARAAIGRLLRQAKSTLWRGRAPIQLDSNGDNTRSGPGRRARAHSEDHRARADGTTRDARNWANWGGVQERPNPIRSHRHCPGCSGHARVLRGAWGIFGRAIGSWALGWFAIWSTGIGIDLPQYIILTGLGFFAATLFRPVWREWINAEDRRSY